MQIDSNVIKAEGLFMPTSRRIKSSAIFAVIPLIFVILFETVVETVRGDDVQAKAAMDKIQGAREPATASDLDKWYAMPPTGQNAADTLLSAFAKLHTDNVSASPTLPILGKGKLPEPGAPLPAAMKTEINSVLTANREALDLIHEGVKLNDCRYPVDFKKGWEMTLPHLAKVKSGVQLLGLEAVAAADDGQTSKAVQAIADIFKLGGTLKGEPMAISQLVRMACNRVGCSTAEWVLNRRTMSDDQLRALAVALKDAEHPQALSRALIGERAQVIPLFQKPLSERKIFLEKAAKEVSGQSMNVSLEDWDADFRSYLAIMDDLIKTSREISPKSQENAEAIGKRAMSSVNQKLYCTALFVPALNGAVGRNLRDIAFLHCAETVVAIERYRRAHEFHLPEKLDELIPNFMEHTPSDPCDEGPLSFEKQTGKGYKISSAGRDGSKPIAIAVIN